MKKKKQRQRIGTGPAPVGGSCEGGIVSTHEEAPSMVETGVAGGSFGATEESAAIGVQRTKWRDSRTEDCYRPALTSPGGLSAHTLGWTGAGS